MEIESATASNVISRAQADIVRRLRRRLKTVRKSHALAEKSLPTEVAIDIALQTATLLQQHAHVYSAGASSMTVKASESGLPSDLTIALEAEWGLGRNIEFRFNEVKKLKRARRIGVERLEQMQKSMKHLEETVASLQSTPHTEAELGRIVK